MEETRTYPVKKPQPKKAVKSVALPEVRLFGKWPNVAEVKDIGLKNYITVKPLIVPKSFGTMSGGRFHKSRMHIVERLANHMLVPGHTGKKHRVSSGYMGGRSDGNLKKIETAFAIIEKKTNVNPVQVLVTAVENAAPREEVTSYQLGSIMARDSVIMSPQRRVDKTLRNIAQGVYKSAFGKKKTVEDALADEIVAAFKSSNDSHAIREKERLERESIGAR
ncbi:MAG: 30S ribosomal protein S7 [Candidatus Aenigmarchaeota archaeon]|nr:30S ribosomal protein S7 [Candidatus Aenigmarchaeota archaeon]